MHEQYNQNQFQRRPPIIVQPSRPRRKKHLRWEFLALPAVIFGAIWLVQGIEPSWRWEDFLDAIGIHNKPRFTSLFVLGVLACGICALARVLKNNRAKDE